jgi:hypothetical protein
MSEIIVRIRPNGTVEAVTSGIKGERCLDYVETVEQITDARTVRSHYTDEYFEGRDALRVEAPDDSDRSRIDLG